MKIKVSQEFSGNRHINSCLGKNPGKSVVHSPKKEFNKIIINKYVTVREEACTTEQRNI